MSGDWRQPKTVECSQGDHADCDRTLCECGCHKEVYQQPDAETVRRQSKIIKLAENAERKFQNIMSDDDLELIAAYLADIRTAAGEEIDDSEGKLEEIPRGE